MKTRHLLLAISITAIWGLNFSVIKLGLTTVDPLILAGIRFTLCALPAIFFIPKPDVQWRYIIGYGQCLPSRPCRYWCRYSGCSAQ